MTSGDHAMEQITGTQETPQARPAGSPRAGHDRLRTALAWTLVGPWGAWALVRLSGADRLPGFRVPVVPLLAVTPYVAAAAPVPVIGAALLRRWRAAMWAGIFAVGLIGVVLPRAFGVSQPAVEGPTVRVLTANLEFSQADPAVVVALVRRTGADVLSLQELTPDGAAALARAGLTRLLPYHVLDAREGPTGSGIYSRHPVRRLPSVPSERVAMPQAELTLPGGRRVEVTAVHPLPPLLTAQSRDWRHDLAALPAPDRRGPVRILAGDYNATVDFSQFRALLGRGFADAAERVGKGLVPTWGVGQSAPPLTIDHVLVDERVAVQRVEVYALPGSDHRALFAQLRLP